MSEKPGEDHTTRSAELEDEPTAKTIRIYVGDVNVQVPRDRARTFEPAVVSKCCRRLAGFDGAVFSLYSKGRTAGGIANHLGPVLLAGESVTRPMRQLPTLRGRNALATIPTAIPR